MKLKLDEAVKSRKSDGTVKSFRCKARKSDGMRRTYLYAAMTEDAAPVCAHRTSRQRRRWTFYEAVKLYMVLLLLATLLSGCFLLGFGSAKNPEQELFDEIMTAYNNRAYESSIKACEQFHPFTD